VNCTSYSPDTHCVITMVHQIRIALLALPSACMEMNNPQSTLPGQRWDMQSISHLMDSTTKLIQHSVTTKAEEEPRPNAEGENNDFRSQNGRLSFHGCGVLS